VDKSGATGDARPLTASTDGEHARRAASFGAAAAAYAEHRPGYPSAAIRWAVEPITVQPGRPVRLLDLGAGTGKLTAQLASLVIGSSPVTVVAVEPDPQMLAELRRQLPGVTALSGRAESIPLPDGSVDAVMAGQAAHWFDLDLAMPEISRVLAPAGVLAGLWNADDDRQDWIASLHQVSGRASTLSPSAVRESDDSNGIAEWLTVAGAGLYGPLEHAGFDHVQRRTADSLIATMRTHSMFLIMEPAERAATLSRVRDFLAATPQTAGGEFNLPIYTIAVRAVRR
jgi:SAM-dependent methyltransferase